MPTFLHYAPTVETKAPDEDATIDGIIAAMSHESDVTRDRYHHAVRTSHAKSHGLVRGELRIHDGLPQHLRQGLFAEAKTHPVIARLAHVPGELLDDRRVSTPRGIALKIFDVDGPKLASHEGEATQDFLFDTGSVFPAPDAKAFLATITTIAKATPAPEIVKQAVSAVSRVTNAMLNAVGTDSPNLDFFGHPPLHPLGEIYYTQVPIRFGDHVAKLALFPTGDMETLKDKKVDISSDANALTTAVVGWIRVHGATFTLKAQLCTDLDSMPVENAHTPWPEEASPYQEIATLTISPQDAASPARRVFVDDGMSFSPSHSLAAHRPLGSIMRARLKAYPVLSAKRRRENDDPLTEPRDIAEMPA